MARFTFKLPDIGEGIASAEIVAWHISPGERIEEDSPLVDMLTDKATVEIETPVAGVVRELAGLPGDAVAIGAMLAVIETDGPAVADEPTPAGAPALPASAQPAPIPAVPTPPAPAPVTAADADAARKTAHETSRVSSGEASSAPHSPAAAPKVLASPAVRARAKALGVDLSHVRAEGAHIRHADLDAFLRYGSLQGYRMPDSGPPRADETVPVIGMRRRIAQNMAASKRHIPHFSYVEEVEATDLEELRAQLNARRGERPRLTLLPFLATAMCRVLPGFPMLNARYDDGSDEQDASDVASKGSGPNGGGTVTRFGGIHLGIATQTPQGLMVPVLRDAQSLNIWQIAGEVARLTAAARSGEAKREELSGSTITLTSLGALGGIASTPVINRPEVAILGVGRLIERPVFADNTSDRIRRAKLMNLSISCDHRVVDGWDAASFVAELKRLIEAPALLLAP